MNTTGYPKSPATRTVVTRIIPGVTKVITLRYSPRKATP
jgi:hypothetical protein